MVKFDCLMMELGAIDKDTPAYSEAISFIALLRTDARTSNGFISYRNSINPFQQRAYMLTHAKDYFVAYHKGLPIGFGGVVEGDIRLAVVPYYQGKGFGKQILSYIKRRNPEATGKVKRYNTSSQNLFDRVEIPYTLI